MSNLTLSYLIRNNLMRAFDWLNERLASCNIQKLISVS